MSIHRRSTRRGARYDVRIRTPAGRPLKRTFTTRKAAEAWERAQLTARDRGDWIDPSARRLPLREIVERWVAANPGKRAATTARDRSALGRYVLADLGDRQVGSLTPDDVQTVVNAAAARGLAPRTVARLYSTLRAVLNYAVAADIIARSPCRGISLPPIDAARARVLDADELAALADAMTPEYSPMVWLGALLGLRWGEAAGLRVGAVDVLGRNVVIDQAVARGAGGHPMLAPPKSKAGRRTLAMPAALAELLGAHMAALKVDGARQDALLFPAAGGGPLWASNWRRRVWIPAVVDAGLGTVDEDDDGRKRFSGPGFHDLRRTSATALVVAGVDVKTAQYRLGHSSPVLTLAVYAQAVTAAERAAADVMGDRLMPPAGASTRHGRAMKPGSGAAG